MAAITTTLNAILAKGPCGQKGNSSGFGKGLKLLGKNQADDEPILLSDIVRHMGIADAIWCFRAIPEHLEIWKRYALWCAEQVRHLMRDERSTRALDVAWMYLDGLATLEELLAAAAADAAAADAAAAYAAAAAAADAAAAAADAAADAAAAAADAADDAAAAADDAADAADAAADADAARKTQKQMLLAICAEPDRARELLTKKEQKQC